MLSDNVIIDESIGAAQRTALVTGAGSGIGLALVESLLEQSSTQRVFAGCRNPAESHALQRIIKSDNRVTLVQLDVTSSTSISVAANTVKALGSLDLLINTAGVLHNNDGMWPEKKVSDISTDDLLLAFDVNALGAMRLAIEFESLLKKSPAPKFISLSARVGSVADNQLGGWNGYRASKAALNMLIKTLSIEWDRLRPKIVCAAVHPGTVATALSAPFTGRRRHSRVTSASAAASQLLDIIAMLTPDNSGGFFAVDGQRIPW